MGQGQSDSDEEVELSQIHSLYTIFMKECPSGAMHLHEFCRIFGVQRSSEDEALFMKTIFQSFDQNQDDMIDFLEFVAAVHLVLRGKLQDRLKWSFKVYDRDENGKLDKNEVKNIIKIICKLKKKNTDMTPDEVCDKIFEHVDLNNDDQISLSEFMVGAQRDAWLVDLLELDVRASSWFRDNWRKKI
ncbi:guanylate cyclase activator 1g [Pangasianodon hypophthalmus]|uniref:guanylate cyclase activator 1g n=1 Tax=Pangasianodon hypophthalmus TaxID=310915 RepID=UPI000EFF1171|nr:guanylate cyclase activator 1g [Pangasianodon hypophthalmus]